MNRKFFVLSKLTKPNMFYEFKFQSNNVITIKKNSLSQSIQSQY